MHSGQYWVFKKLYIFDCAIQAALTCIEVKDLYHINFTLTCMLLLLLLMTTYNFQQKDPI